MDLYPLTIAPMIRVLRNMRAWLDEASAYAEERSFDRDILLTTRLYPDQFTFVQQIRAACDTAKGLAARLAGQTPPKHADDETTWTEVEARIEKVLAYLETFDAAAIEGDPERSVPLFFMPGKGMTAIDFTTGFAVPNFYFHATAAYSILRTNGVLLGKMKYLTMMPMHDL